MPVTVKKTASSALNVARRTKRTESYFARNLKRRFRESAQMFLVLKVVSIFQRNQKPLNRAIGVRLTPGVAAVKRSGLLSMQARRPLY